jgi:xanthine dehydrogenase accessory factor
VLVTVTAATGATPRGTGARMLVGREGRLCGTIGGGAVEYRAEQLALRTLETKQSGQQNFSLTRADVENLGMICGGAVEVYFHYLPPFDPAAMALAEEAERLFGAGRAIWLLTCISHGGALSLYTREEGVFGHPLPEEVTASLTAKAAAVRWGELCFCAEQIQGAGRVYLFGAGHVSRELEPLLSHVGFRCVVMDDRPEFADRAHFPTAEEVLTVNFEDIDSFVSIGAEDYVCILTRGHAWDTAIQAQVLRKAPCYVGVIGSRKKAAAVREALRTQYGLSDGELDRVTTPIGLEIGAQTPAEIAVSIAAQMIQVRSGRSQ